MVLARPEIVSEFAKDIFDDDFSWIPSALDKIIFFCRSLWHDSRLGHPSLPAHVRAAIL